MRTIGAALLAVVIALTGWAILGRSTSKAPSANTTTTTLPTTTIATQTSATAPTTIGPVTAPTSGAEPVPANAQIFADLKRYFDVTVVRKNDSLASFTVTVRNISGRTIAPSELGDAICELAVHDTVADAWSDPAVSEPCSELLALGPNETRGGDVGFMSGHPEGGLSVWLNGTHPGTSKSTTTVIYP